MRVGAAPFWLPVERPVRMSYKARHPPIHINTPEKHLTHLYGACGRAERIKQAPTPMRSEGRVYARQLRLVYLLGSVLELHCVSP